MDNVSPELLEKCKQAFADQYAESKTIQKLVAKVRDGTATLADANNYSTEIGKILGKALGSVLKDDNLPEGKLFWNIAQDVIAPMISQNHDLVNVMSKECQKIVYKNANIGISVKSPKKDNERIKGLLDNVVAAEDEETRIQRLTTDSENITDSFFDNFVEDNADEADKVGYKTKVIRTVASSGCCAWCDSLAGTYDYDDVKDKGNEVWRRHTNCTCEIEYITEKYAEKANNFKTINPRSGKPSKK